MPGETSLSDYIKKYYESDFVRNRVFDEQKRSPFDSYVWASGIIFRFSGTDDYYKNAIDFLFRSLCNKSGIDPYDQIKDVHKQIVNIINDNSVVRSFMILLKFFPFFLC